MASRKALIVDSGTVKELPDGDSLTGVGSFPFFESDGTPAPIPLTADGKLPFFKADGSPSDIPLTV